MGEALRQLTEGMPVVYGGDRVTRVPAELAAAFQPGDRLIVVQTTGDLLRVPAAIGRLADDAVARAHQAFAELATVSDEQITGFYERFALRLADDEVFAPIAAANVDDVADARDRGRSTTRLELSDRMRSDMIASLRLWRDAPAGRGRVVETIDHPGWRVEQITAGLGVVGFVFEGRPNVFADACGVLRSGNSVVFRIGRDALRTARAIVEHALAPALADSGLPAGAAVLVDSAERSAGWAMFADRRLGLAVARGSGPAVDQLGAVASQAGVPVSLHGTGGAWLVAGDDAHPDHFRAAVRWSLDRKVCNTLNTCAVPDHRADELVPVFLDALDDAGRAREATAKLHVVAGQRHRVPEGWFEPAAIHRAEGIVTEARTSEIAFDALGTEWEWDHSPEVSLVIVDSVDDAIDAFNRLSPRLVATLISADAARQQHFFDRIDAPFVGNGFTRWVDGQYALGRPELGLSNWERGRLFGRGGVLSGDSVFTVRTRVTQSDPDVHR